MENKKGRRRSRCHGQVFGPKNLSASLPKIPRRIQACYFEEKPVIFPEHAEYSEIEKQQVFDIQHQFTATRDRMLKEIRMLVEKYKKDCKDDKSIVIEKRKILSGLKHRIELIDGQIDLSRRKIDQIRATRRQRCDLPNKIIKNVKLQAEEMSKQLFYNFSRQNHIFYQITDSDPDKKTVKSKKRRKQKMSSSFPDLKYHENYGEEENRKLDEIIHRYQETSAIERKKIREIELIDDMELQKAEKSLNQLQEEKEFYLNVKHAELGILDSTKRKLNLKKDRLTKALEDMNKTIDHARKTAVCQGNILYLKYEEKFLIKLK